MRQHVPIALLTSTLAVCALVSQALTADETMFPFVVPWDDSTPGTATDVRALTPRPAGANGFVTVKDGVFVEGDSGRRIRFLGVNLTAGSAFPSKPDAERIAARLAKLGVNVARFHHLQNSWGKSIWKEGRTFVEIDPERVDQLDYFVAALKREGIYTNLNLSTTREYVPELGFPESVKQIPTNHHKKVDRWNRRMIDLQKEYAAALLDHVNPYTGQPYKDEPALAFVEISNEDSIVGWPGETPGQGLDQMPEPFRSELTALWNDFLVRRYEDDAGLLSAWRDGTGEHGADLIARGWPLSFENQVAPTAANHSLRPLAGNAAGSAGARVTIHETGADWTIQLFVADLTLDPGKSYTVSFRARASTPRPLGFKLHLDQPDWQLHGLHSTVNVTREWQDFAVSFEAAHTVPGHSRLAFLLGDHAGEVELSNVRLREGAIPFTSGKGESLGAGNVAIAASGATGRRKGDWIDFLASADSAFASEMRAYLRETLGLRANLVDSQIPWGGLTSLAREASMEWADNHAYWQHPDFPGGSWDEARWTIRQRPLVNEMDGTQGTMRELAQWRVAGKPYTISEYNHPAPNDYQSETLPLLVTVAALQDWDAIYLFDYPETGSDRDNEAITGFFDCAIDPAKVAFLPSAALILRNGLIPAAGARDTLGLPEPPWAQGLDIQSAWKATGGMPDVLRRQLAIAAGTGSTVTRMRGAAEGSGVARVERHSRGAVLVADAPAAKVIVGFVGGQSIGADGMIASFPEFGRKAEGFAAVTLVAHHKEAIASASRLLLTTMGRAENLDMGWNADRTSVGDKWGKGPVHAEGISAHISIDRTAPSRVYALDERGRRKEEVFATQRDGKLLFEIGPSHHTVWYEISTEDDSTATR